MNKYLLAMLLGVSGLLVTPGDSQAQRWGRGYGWGRGGVGISIGTPYYYSSVYGYGNNWGYPGYGYSNYGYWPSSYGRGYSYYPSYYGSSYGYMPSYYGSSYSYLPSNYGSSYSPSYSWLPSNTYSGPTRSTSFYYSPSLEQSTTALMDKAAVEVRVPADAELWIDGQPTNKRGETRTFETPMFEVGRSFTYEIRARWTQDGQPVERTRTVDLQAGTRPVVNFLTEK
jgi:uncharacterized protein (TIGR03000 family)